MNIVYLVFKESDEGNDYLEGVFETGSSAQKYIDHQDQPFLYYIKNVEVLND